MHLETSQITVNTLKCSYVC